MPLLEVHSNACVFALGIMPYISASIVVQLMGIAVPSSKASERRRKGIEKEIKLRDGNN